MTARAQTLIDISDPARLPPRLTTAEVCALARFGPVTLRRRQRAGKFPTAIPGEHGIYLRDQVLQALGLAPHIGNPSDDIFRQAADAFHQDRTSRQRRKAA